MARIIRGSENNAQSDFAPRSGGRIIEGEVYKARLKAEQIVEQAQEQRQERFREANVLASQVEEGAVLEGFSQSCDEAAQRAIRIFVDRHTRVEKAKEELREVALAIAQKILGTSLHLNEADKDRIIEEESARLIASRKLRLEGLAVTLDVFRVRAKAKGFDVEAVDDLEAGQVRVVTEFGPIVCSKNAVIEAFNTEASDG